MEYLIALIPALGWGLMPLITGKMGGSEANQIFGIGAGASIVGIIAFLITQPTVSAGAFIFSMVCGALLIVIIGALMTSVSDKKGDSKVTTSNVIFLLATTIGYWIYSSFPKIPYLANQSSEGIFLPEVLGILVGAILYELFTGNAKAFGQKEQYTNILGGISWGIAAFAYIFAARSLGVNVAFIFTQLNVVIATFGGILVLHEHKSSHEMKFTLLGILLIVIGSVATIFA
ncbi:sugar transporter [Limosilactobacillus fermentum]